MTTAQKNAVLATLLQLLEAGRQEILTANAADLHRYDGSDAAMYDRLNLDDEKVSGMIRSVREVLEKPDPVGVERYRFQHENGMTVLNKTASFGAILIIYESRPDVTIEAAVLAFKSGNKILLKGGKEARLSNLCLTECWQEALRQNGLSPDWVRYLDYSREEIQQFLKGPGEPLDLVVPRGGERLIEFVRQHAACPVLVSGRGNNFLFVHRKADWEMALSVILSAKTQKISACNALDKVLVDAQLPDLKPCLEALTGVLAAAGVEVWLDSATKEILNSDQFPVVVSEEMWREEFLALKMVVGISDNLEAAIETINRYSGGHSASILTADEAAAAVFMEQVDTAAVYHNASTRFTDGGQFGMGAELAISTDKLHHRGPLGLEHLVTNKWFVFGSGQIR